jgi:hypothetical protein
MLSYMEISLYCVSACMCMCLRAARMCVQCVRVCARGAVYVNVFISACFASTCVYQCMLHDHVFRLYVYLLVRVCTRTYIRHVHVCTCLCVHALANIWDMCMCMNAHNVHTHAYRSLSVCRASHYACQPYTHVGACPELYKIFHMNTHTWSISQNQTSITSA